MHVLSGLIGLIGGSFNKIIKEENGEISIEFEIPFKNVKSGTINRTTYSPKTKGNWKRTINEGKYILSSPISGFRNIGSDHSSRNKISGEKLMSIRETIQNITLMESDSMLLSRSNRSICTPRNNSRLIESEQNQIRVNRLSQMTVSSAAPIAIQQESDEANQNMTQTQNVNQRKNNFASKNWEQSSVSDDSMSSSHSNSFINPSNELIYAKKKSLVHPRLRFIEREERINKSSFKKIENNKTQGRLYCNIS
jgi:hypothetical protein